MTALRWEWRTFGESFEVAEERLGSMPERIVDTAETYLLAEGSVDAVKFRDGLMDIKRLEEVDENGLELWRPIMKSPMPISTADAEIVLAALRVSAPLDRDRYGLADLVLAVNGGVRAIPVHKTRRHFAIEGCMAEVTDLWTAGRSTRTIVIESETPAHVIAVVRELGLDSRPNVSIPKELKRLL